MGRITGLLLLLWAGATVSTVLDLQKRIIGGKQCNDNERKYHVKLEGSNGTHINPCGGSLISDQWVLTAAHCLIPGWDLKAEVGVHPYRGRPREITEAVPFKDKDANGNDRTHDIMLLKLSDTIDITPVALPDCNSRPNINDVVQIAGLTVGTIGPNKERVCDDSAELQCAEADVVDCEPFINCLKQSDPKSYKATHYQHMLCAKRNQVDACPGDSGGGVVYNGRIYGVFVRSGVYACTLPMRYMNICEPVYREWIEKTVPELKFPE